MFGFGRNKPKIRYVDQCKEFATVDDMNTWLFIEQGKAYKRIKRCYRNADNKYFIQYLAKFFESDKQMNLSEKDLGK